MNDFPESDTPFNFEQLLYGDDWQRWDTYPTVDGNANLLHSTVEMNHGGLTIEPNPISVIYPMVLPVIIYFLQVFLRDIKLLDE